MSGPIAAEPAVARTRRLRTKIIAFGAALLVAVLAALAVGLLAYRKLSAGTPELSAGRAQPVVVDGFSYRLDSFTVARQLPAQDKGDPTIHGPAGSMLVLVVYSQTPVSRTADLQDHQCTPTLRSADAVWEPDDDFTDLVRRPEAQDCYGTTDDPLHYDQVKQIGVSFVVPAAVSDQVTFRLALTQSHQVIDLHR